MPPDAGENIRASSLGGFHFAIPKGAKEADGAFKVIETMSDPALFQQGWGVGGLLAPRTDSVSTRGGGRVRFRGVGAC